MSWLDIDGTAAKPSAEELKASRSTIRFEPVETDVSEIEAVLDAFRDLFTNGDVAIATVRVTHLDDAGRWYLTRRRFGEFGLSDRLLHSDELRTVFPPAATTVHLEEGVEHVSPLTLDGRIAALLTWGGAYGTFPDSWSEAKRLGQSFSDAVIGERFEDFQIEYFGTGWSSWFRCHAWDFTWLIVDRRFERIVIFCGTDTD